MNRSEYKMTRKDGFITSEDVCLEDDGFFSDVQSSGSLSKSRIALNKYLKKNLLYEDVDYKDDSAYFSKEGSPNESVSKSDTESVKSNDSYETKRPLSHDTSITDFVKSYESNHAESSQVTRPKPFELKSLTKSKCEINQEQSGNTSETETKNVSDYKVYPKERWPDKYRRKSDTSSLKPSEFSKTKRSMSQGETIEEFIRSYQLNQRNEFKTNGYHPKNAKTASSGKKQYISESTITEKEYGAFTNIESENTSLSQQPNRRLSQNSNNIESVLSFHPDDSELSKESNNFQIKNGTRQENQKSHDTNPQHMKILVLETNGTDLGNESYVQNESYKYVQNSDSESISSNYCTTKQYLPQEATISVTKVVKSYDADNINKKHLYVPTSDSENLKNDQPEARLPSPVPLPRSSSLRKEQKPYVPKRTYSNNSGADQQTIDSNTKSSEPLESKGSKLQTIIATKVINTKRNYDSDVTSHVEQTDDYKSMQLLEKPKKSNDESNPEAKQSTKSASDINLCKENNPRDVSENEVILREKSHRLEEHRHTLHDFSGWVNRTTKYPDVYAPMPYKSPRRYVESDVNIHYRVPVRQEPRPLVPEQQLAQQQAEHMQRLYRDQKRNKYLQENDISPLDIEAFDASMKELQDMQSRRHQDNFLPKDKSVVPLDRYDAAGGGIAGGAVLGARTLARALYAFTGQTPRELSFRKGDLIAVRRQIDHNWYEGELHGRHGLFPYNYVEILKSDVPSPVGGGGAAAEGQARAKFDFPAHTGLELPLRRGELVALTRRVDDNWWEGRRAGTSGIFPDSYVTVLKEPQPAKAESESGKPAASPAAHGLVNGSARRSMGAHAYTPQHNSPALTHAPQPTTPLPGYTATPAQARLAPASRGYGPPTAPGADLNNSEPLYVDTNAEAVPYRALYAYRPQNPDELELRAGDTVYVLERCDDGWYVGSSQRSARFGTFPGNYVERI